MRKIALVAVIALSPFGAVAPAFADGGDGGSASGGGGGSPTGSGANGLSWPAPVVAAPTPAAMALPA